LLGVALTRLRAGSSLPSMLSVIFGTALSPLRRSLSSLLLRRFTITVFARRGTRSPILSGWTILRLSLWVTWVSMLMVVFFRATRRGVTRIPLLNRVQVCGLAYLAARLLFALKLPAC